MKKNAYQKPMTIVIKLQQRHHILAASEVAEEPTTTASFDDYEDGTFNWNE